MHCRIRQFGNFMVSQDATPAGDLTIMNPTVTALSHIVICVWRRGRKNSGNVLSPAHCMDTPDDGLHLYKAHANAELQDSGNSRTSHAKSNTLCLIKSS